MTWKDYQIKETKKSAFWALTVRVFSFALIAALGWNSISYAKKKWIKSDVVAKVFKDDQPKKKSDLFNNILANVSFESIQNSPKEVKVFREGTDWTLQLTVDPDLQKYIYDKLQQYQVDWAGVSVVDAKTGAVKALVSYSSKEPEIDHLSLRATFPAASIFKVVTAGAAIQAKQYRPESVFTYGGDTRYVNKRNLNSDSGASITLGDAFAHSTNGIFAKVGARYVGIDLLSKYASAFGFNEVMPFDFPVQESFFPKTSSEDDLTSEGRTAAGLGDVTLSPLHASLMAASIVNNGVMMKPYAIEKITNENQETYFEAKPEIWKSPLTAKSSEQIKRMMRMTVNSGTARRGFRDYQRDSILSSLDIGGKTGSLTGKDPDGKNEWFVGFAKDGESSLAFGIVIVDKKFWKIKPSELAKNLIRYHFKGMRDSEPKEITSVESPRVKKATL